LLFSQINNLVMNSKIIDYLRKETNYKPVKLTEKIAEILDISFDSAYRRVSNKVEFTISEVGKIALYYKFSIDEVLFLSATNNVLFKTPDTVKDAASFIIFLQKTNQMIFDYVNKPNTTMYYAAKDIPFYYTVGQNYLSKLKTYIWLYSTNQRFSANKIPFSDYAISPEVKKETMRISFLNETINSVEIWNASTIDSILFTIQYLKKIKLITLEEIHLILEELKELLESIKQNASNGKKEYGKKIELYYNSLYLMNNSILLKSDDSSTGIIQYNLIEYLNTRNYKICSQLEDYFEYQIHFSKNLTKSNDEDRDDFFDLLNKKIDTFIGNDFIFHS